MSGFPLDVEIRDGFISSFLAEHVEKFNLHFSPVDLNEGFGDPLGPGTVVGSYQEYLVGHVTN